MDFVPFMEIAIAQAEEIVRGGKLIAAAHDSEDTERDPTAHAEINAVRAASRVLGKDLYGCALVSTHEPCPMCATAAHWAKIETVVYGMSIKDALSQGRKRIDLGCEEFFERMGADVEIRKGIMREACSRLYRRDIRTEIERLRNADEEALRALNEDSVRRRTGWFRENKDFFDFDIDDPVLAGYYLLLARLNITQEEAPIVKKTDTEIVFHSMNFCPTLEACRILGLDTRHICRHLNENATDTLLKQLDPRLRFSRDYKRLRPHTPYCEEMIRIKNLK